MLRVGSSVIELVKGDITELEVDAIVNAANSSLKMGGGVAGAILKKGGWSIQEECDRIGYCPVGGAVITGAGRLKARYVIHAVGPRMGEGDEDNKLRSATLSSLKLAEQHNVRSIAFPAISTGIFGFPKDRCAKIMLRTAVEYLQKGSRIERVIFCLYDDETYKIFEEELEKIKKGTQTSLVRLPHLFKLCIVDLHVVHHTSSRSPQLFFSGQHSPPWPCSSPV
jgi:O-acetyl-ADP-ribose deacetylase (regulator of RNase III)